MAVYAKKENTTFIVECKSNIEVTMLLFTLKNNGYVFKHKYIYDDHVYTVEPFSSITIYPIWFYEHNFKTEKIYVSVNRDKKIINFVRDMSVLKEHEVRKYSNRYIYDIKVDESKFSRREIMIFYMLAEQSKSMLYEFKCSMVHSDKKKEQSTVEEEYNIDTEKKYINYYTYVYAFRVDNRKTLTKELKEFVDRLNYNSVEYTVEASTLIYPCNTNEIERVVFYLTLYSNPVVNDILEWEVPVCYTVLFPIEYIESDKCKKMIVKGCDPIKLSTNKFNTLYNEGFVADSYYFIDNRRPSSSMFDVKHAIKLTGDIDKDIQLVKDKYKNFYYIDIDTKYTLNHIMFLVRNYNVVLFATEKEFIHGMSLDDFRLLYR